MYLRLPIISKRLRNIFPRISDTRTWMIRYHSDRVQVRNLIVVMGLKEQIIQNVAKHPVLYDPNCVGYGQVRRREKAWEEITREIYINQWNRLTLQEQVKKSHQLQTIWQSSNERNVLESFHRRQPQVNTNVADVGIKDEPDSPEMAGPSTSQFKDAEGNKENSERDMDKDLLLLYLLPIYKLLKENDKHEMLYQCHKLMKERLDHYSSQKTSASGNSSEKK